MAVSLAKSLKSFFSVSSIGVLVNVLSKGSVLPERLRVGLKCTDEGRFRLKLAEDYSKPEPGEREVYHSLTVCSEVLNRLQSASRKPGSRMMCYVDTQGVMVDQLHASVDTCVPVSQATKVVKECAWTNLSAAGLRGRIGSVLISTSGLASVQAL